MKVKVCLALALISVIILQFCEASSNVPDEGTFLHTKWVRLTEVRTLSKNFNSVIDVLKPPFKQY